MVIFGFMQNHIGPIARWQDIVAQIWQVDRIPHFPSHRKSLLTIALGVRIVIIAWILKSRI